MKLAVFLLGCLALSALAQTSPRNTIVENAIGLPQLSTLVSVVASPGYESVLGALNNPNANLTLFAPDNRAFAEAGVDPSQIDFVIAVLYYHVLPAKVRSTALAALQFPNSLMSNASLVNLGGKGQVLGVTKSNGRVDINFGIPGVSNYTATVLTADVECVNGIIHIISKVLLPPKAASETALEAGLTSLAEALIRTNLLSAVDSLTSITVFAPTNEAFDRIPGWQTLPVDTLSAILLYHVVPAVGYSVDLSNGLSLPTLNGATVRVGVTNTGVTVNNARVLVPNALIKNGVVHVIDSVLLPPFLAQKLNVRL